MLIDPVYKRQTPIDMTAVEEFGIDPKSEFFKFYYENEGVFSSNKTGFCLLDLTSGEESVVSQSKLVHSEFKIPKRYLVISDYLGNGVLMYDVETTAVYNVDFEGGDRELIEGTLSPTYDSFSDFIRWYFESKFR